jgi:hypothetical protein
MRLQGREEPMNNVKFFFRGETFSLPPKGLHVLDSETSPRVGSEAHPKYYFLDRTGNVLFGAESHALALKYMLDR